MQYPPQEILRELLDYNPDTGIFTWRIRDRRWFCSDKSWKTFNTRDSGKPAGNTRVNKKGYRSMRIRILGKSYLAHRVAWVYMNGDDSLPGEVDHANGDATDNRWSNLRSGDNWVNHSNKSVLSNSTTGISGVCWHKQAAKWRAYVKKDGVQKSLGLYTRIEDAKNAAERARAEMGFDPRHGSRRPY